MVHLYSSYARDICLTWWQINYVIGDRQWYLFSQRMMQLVRTQITFGSIILFLRRIISKFVRFLLNFELRARWSKVLFSNQTLYMRIVKTMYRISPDRLIPVLIDISIYWFTPSDVGLQVVDQSKLRIYIWKK